MEELWRTAAQRHYNKWLRKGRSVKHSTVHTGVTCTGSTDAVWCYLYWLNRCNLQKGCFLPFSLKRFCSLTQINLHSPPPTLHLPKWVMYTSSFYSQPNHDIQCPFPNSKTNSKTARTQAHKTTMLQTDPQSWRTQRDKITRPQHSLTTPFQKLGQQGQVRMAWSLHQQGGREGVGEEETHAVAP